MTEKHRSSKLQTEPLKTIEKITFHQPKFYEKTQINTGKYFYLTPGICPSLSTMKPILESAGGKLLAKQPSYRKIMEHKQNKNLPEIILISCDNDLHLCREYFLKNIDVHNAEFILTGVLTQQLDYDSYKFT